MIDPVQQTLLEGSKALAQASSRARGWVARVAQSAVSVSNEEHSLIETTRKSENLARKLQSSSSRRNSAGVFGPSQAGKSYLVSVLGKSKGKPLIVDFAGTPKNFIQEINPEGGKEATGLVTRFTIVKGSRDVQHPVELRLLTETDLVKIIGNSFLSDFSQENRKLGLPAEDTVRALMLKLEAAARPSGPMHVDEIAMFDIGEYFRENFPVPTERLVNVGYFDALTRFGHRLPTPQRIELYSIMWGLSKDLTDVYLLLHKTLDTLGHPATGRAALDCLMPRARSIIDVDILKNHLGTPEDMADTISVVPELSDGAGDGPVVQVPRAILTALVAEIKVVMADKPWNFFEHTDLLDFPGARSREKMIDLPSDTEDRTAAVRNMLLRGKIAYLFQRYTDERELTCILLCMPPSNQEVKDLTALVAKWVDQTHGSTPEARAKLPCGLFFVVTKFDQELEAKPGDTPGGESWLNRIDTRLEASMYQLYKQSEWLYNWDGKPFANTFFLRNPDYKLPSVFTYGPASTTPPGETGVTSEAAPRIAANRKGMVESERCRKHFASPELAWDSALLPNDGGVTYLVDNLERVLSPRLKTNQLAGRLLEQAQTLDGRMRRFYQADDDASRDKKEAELTDMRMRLYRACADRSFANFVQMLAMMKLDLEAVRGAFLNVASLRLEAAQAADESATHASAAAVAGSAGIFDQDDDPWGAEPTAPETPAPKKAAPPPRRQRDRADMFAVQVLNMWTERVRGLSANTPRLATLGFDMQLAGDLGNELVIGAHRNQLIEQIAEKVRSQVAAANVRWDEVADRSAGIATTLVNDFVSYLGFGELPPDKRPAVPEAPKPRARGVFVAPPLPAKGQPPMLGERRTTLERNYFLDWGVSLKQLGLDNMSFSGGREIDETENRALGQILNDMSPALHVTKG